MRSDICYQRESDLPVSEFIAVLKASTLAERRPVEDIARMDLMLRQADLIMTARCDGVLVGIARTLTDHSYSTYLADLAVNVAFQGCGIGRELIRLTHEAAGLHTNLILIAAPGARSYYPHIGMAAHESCWMTRGQPSQPSSVA